MLPRISPATGRWPLRAPSRAQRRGALLLEVIISILILGLAVAALLRSFTLSVSSARTIEITTTAVVLAEQLIEQYQVLPPEKDEEEGNFGDSFPNYFYRVKYEEKPPRYESESHARDVAEDLEPMRLVTVEIIYDDGSYRRLKPITLTTALMPIEMFTYASRNENHLY